jgi:hypothetical protein
VARFQAAGLAPGAEPRQRGGGAPAGAGAGWSSPAPRRLETPLPTAAALTAFVQLGVPAIAALFAVVLLGETLDLRLVSSGALVMGGVALAITARPGRSRVDASRPVPGLES